jgi:hypothetical protein
MFRRLSFFLRRFFGFLVLRTLCRIYLQMIVPPMKHKMSIRICRIAHSCRGISGALASRKKSGAVN